MDGSPWQHNGYNNDKGQREADRNVDCTAEPGYLCICYEKNSYDDKDDTDNKGAAYRECSEKQPFSVHASNLLESIASEVRQIYQKNSKGSRHFITNSYRS
jgi:hypothetical protein